MLETLGHYKILERIGAGGLGDLYRARDTRHGRTVAIRIVRPELVAEAGRRERLLQHARAGVALSHPSITTLYEAGEDQGYLFLATEYVPGQTLRSVIGGRAINPRRALELAAQIADALAEAHAAGILHGDIKPDNVIVTPKGNAKVLEMGLTLWTAGGAARASAGRITTAAAVQDAVIGRTAPYLSPEQARGGEVDYRTDIFSLGVVLFEMLTGRVPFEASPSDVTEEVVSGPLAAPSSLNRSVPSEVDAVVERMLAKSADDRHTSAATVAAELRALVVAFDHRTRATKPPLPVGAPKRQSGTGWILALAALAGIAALIWFASRL